ncbi:hypothetical protein N7510_002533 [Penicillium lagena]|uniref:uncharacterized protein n=1 Tax=Penicillium lagena TaxID=94218 RepID=UPI002541CDC8|nr:uncharacterized protein N7510_002533 [Penicillium lagena]KAJ5626224.1 hypothetical protein N7510_002533 [Penicillium lagena]
MSAAIPPGGTWFDTIKKSFADVPIDAANDDGISTTEFLEAAESLTTLFDLLGSKAFLPVKNDLLGNIKVRCPSPPPTPASTSNPKIQKVRERQLAAPAESETLQALVLNELKAGKHTATEGLLWLVRGLDFTAQALRHNLDNSAVELSNSFREAYGGTLKPHHSFVIKPIFSAAMSATPYRKDFYAKMGDDQAKIATAMNREVQALEKVVAILKTFQARKDAQWK